MAIFDLNELDKNKIEEAKKIYHTNNEILEEYVGLLNKGREHDKAVFISHRSSNKPKAKMLANYFDNNSFDVYLDIGDDLLQWKINNSGIENISDDEITELLNYGIKSCEYLICLIPSNITESKWVEGEIKFARSKDKDILGINMENYDLPSYFGVKKILKTEEELSEYFEIKRMIDSCNR